MTIKLREIQKKEHYARCPQCGKEIKGTSEIAVDKNLQSHYHFIHVIKREQEEVKE